jgi:hypothetical protein
MLGTSTLYVRLSVKNRILQRLRRLKQPRYLVGLFVGILYMVILLGRDRNRILHIDGQSVPIDPAVGVALLTIFAAAIMILCWALPESEAGLDLTETEALFLFPAPITRGQLFGFVVARGLFPQVISALIFKFFFLRHLSFFGVLVTVFALQIYFLMVKIARARLRVAGIGFLSRAAATLLLCGLVATLTWGQYGGLLATIEKAGRIDPEELMAAVAAPMHALPLSVIFFVPGLYARVAAGTSFASTAPALVAVVALTALFGWIAVRLDVSYEEATIARARKRAARRAARLDRSRGLGVSRRTPFRFPLAPVGRPEIAIVWKNSMAAARTVLLVFLIPIFLVVVLIVVVASSSSMDVALPVGSALAFLLAGMATFIGPVLFRNDLRTDLARLDVLRGYPLSGRQLVAAEIASPALLLFGLQAICLVAGVVPAMLSGGVWSGMSVLGWGVLAMLFALPLTVIQLLGHNGMVVLFPAWASFSKEDQRGIEAFGRRLLLLAAQMITLAIGLFPAALLFAGTFLLTGFGGLASMTSRAIVASVPALMTLAFEITWAVNFLGDQLDRIDVSDNMAITEEP